MALITILVVCACRATPEESAAAAPAKANEANEPRAAGTTAPPPEGMSAKAEPAAAPPPTPDPSPPAPAAEKPPAPEASDDDALLSKNLEGAIRDTPFSAVVQYLSVKEVPLGDGDVKLVYQVRVIEPIRGPKLKKLTYFAIVEKGEDTSFEKEPVILTLCKGKKGFYWPGTGAEFPRNEQTGKLVTKLRPELKADQKEFLQCPSDE